MDFMLMEFNAWMFVYIALSLLLCQKKKVQSDYGIIKNRIAS